MSEKDPVGSLIVILGPDGSGKSTVAEELAAILTDSGITAERLYMGAGTPGLPTRRLRQALRRRRRGGPRALNPSRSHTVREVLHTWLDFRWRERTQIRPLLETGVTVICDRYAYDMATWNVPKLSDERLAGLLYRFTRRPDHTILLDAPADVVRSRRDELTTDEISRQQRRLRGLLVLVPGAEVVDATPSARDVAMSVAARVQGKPTSPGRAPGAQ